MEKIILASNSPRRKELLEMLNLKFDVLGGNADENAVSKELSPDMYVRSLAVLKAADVAKKIKKDSLIISADTVVELDEKFLGKPKNEEDATNMLMLLSGKTHNVYTGICVMRNSDGFAVGTYEKTLVTFKELSKTEIENYIKTNEPFDKAGGYAIQGLASVFIEKICGDYFNVVGLPLFKLSKLLKDEFNFDVTKGFEGR